jgi:hypothetical protein
MDVGGQHHAPAASPPGKSLGTHFTQDWVRLRALLGGYGEEKIYSPTRDEPRIMSP